MEIVGGEIVKMIKGELDDEIGINIELMMKIIWYEYIELYGIIGRKRWKVGKLKEKKKEGR